MVLQGTNLENRNVHDNTCNHQCSRCGECCGLFIPFTEKELTIIKEYVKTHNIQPTNRINQVTGVFNAHCCFYDEVNKKCNIYEVRPYVCRDFKCDRKDWLQRRNQYEKRGKYNSTLNDKMIMATFDDKVYEDYEPILRYCFSIISDVSGRGIDSKTVVEFLKHINREDILNHITAIDENGNKYSGTEIANAP